MILFPRTASNVASNVRHFWEEIMFFAEAQFKRFRRSMKRMLKGSY